MKTIIADTDNFGINQIHVLFKSTLKMKFDEAKI